MQLRRFFQNEKNVIFPDLLILMMNLSLIRQRQLNILLYGQLGQFFFGWSVGKVIIIILLSFRADTFENKKY